MSEVIQWAKLTPEERDRLVAEKVMGWDPNAPCTGRWVPLDPEPDGLYCTGCGAEIGWGTKEWADHHDQPRAKAYTQSMDLAWEVLKEIDAHHDEIMASFAYHLKCQYATPEGYDTFEANLAQLAQWTPERICIAALRAFGVKIEQ